METIRKSSKALHIAAEICNNKTEDCISLVEEYVKSYNKEDPQVGEASHFVFWLEINKKVSINLINKLKSKYSVSTTNLQNGSTTDTQDTTNVSKIHTPTSEQEEQPVNLNSGTEALQSSSKTSTPVQLQEQPAAQPDINNTPDKNRPLSKFKNGVQNCEFQL